MNRLWSRLSANERRLAVVTAGLAAAFLLYIMIVPAIGYLRDLDEEIEYLEQETVNMARQAARRSVVEERYNRLASQHSTQLTAAQISDSLVSELDRLSLAEPEGDRNKRLVTIASRPAGQLSQYQGYREYQAGFELAPSRIGALAEFIRRLQESPQVLRIDRMELRREPQSKSIVAGFVVTRTVVDSPEQVGKTQEGTPQPAPEPAEATPAAEPKPKAPAPAVPEAEPKAGGNLAKNGGFDDWDAESRTFPEWVAKDCTLTQGRSGNTTALVAVAPEGKGQIYQIHKLVAGATYRASIDLAATGNVRLAVLNARTGEPFIKGALVKADGKMYRCSLGEFKVPGTSGEEVLLVVPYVTLESKGAEVRMDNAVLERVK